MKSEWSPTTWFWLLSRSIVFSRVIHVVTAVSASFHFCGWIISHYMSRPHFVYPLRRWWTFGLIHLLALVISAAVNRRARRLARTPAFSYFGYKPGGGGSAGSCGSSMVNSLKTHQATRSSLMGFQSPNLAAPTLAWPPWPTKLTTLRQSMLMEGLWAHIQIFLVKATDSWLQHYL